MRKLAFSQKKANLFVYFKISLYICTEIKEK